MSIYYGKCLIASVTPSKYRADMRPGLAAKPDLLQFSDLLYPGNVEFGDRQTFCGDLSQRFDAIDQTG